MIVPFAVSIFLSAFLLFLVEPIVAKMILPVLGGNPSVWNSCMLFFQTVLLAGYAYVHLVSTRMPHRQELITHLTLVLIPLFVLPVHVSVQSSLLGVESPILWLLKALALSVGLPFFVLSTTAPLLQKWFVRTAHSSARDPYFLYAASNAGSMLALVGYPVMIEPWIPVQSAQWLSQSWLWSAGYLLLAGCLGWTAWMVRCQVAQTVEGNNNRSISLVSSRPTAWTLTRWLLLAFVPSSLMLGVTSHISLNIAAIPLFWIIPLALYLLSFILVFARWSDAMHRRVVVVTSPLLLLLILTLMPSGLTLPLWLAIVLHLMTLFVVALVCHGELARSRPATAHLTLFYLVMSFGGALGGLFNAVAAPLIFHSFVEYQVSLVMAAALLPRFSTESSNEQVLPFPTLKPILADLAWAVLLAAFAAVLIWASASNPQNKPVASIMVYSAVLPFEELIQAVGMQWKDVSAMLACAVPLILCACFIKRPLRFGLGLGAILLVASYASTLTDKIIIHQERSFFGVLRVEWDKEHGWHTLLHGGTNHGKQYLDPARQQLPLTYYHPTGPIGQALQAFQGPFHKQHIAVIGLGTGSLASYVSASQSLTFYEIDPAVVRIAKDPRFFTYYQAAESRGAKLRTVVGDARLNLNEASDQSYDLIVLDAFSSDAIPVHLLTREAMELYLRKLTSEGVIAVHISNRYLRLETILGNVQRELRLTGLKQFDDEGNERVPGKSASDWVLLTRKGNVLGPLGEDYRWTTVAENPTIDVWSDNFSNVLAVLDWSTTM